MKDILNCLVLEDELKSQEYISDLINSHANLNLLHMCSTAQEAAGAIGRSNQQIDLLFLDVELEEGRGDRGGLLFIQLIEALNLTLPYTIITSKSRDHAFDTFNIAFDYLHKPFTEIRFEESIQKILAKRNKSRGIQFLTVGTQNQNKDRGVALIPIKEIIYFESDTEIQGNIKIWHKSSIGKEPVSYSTRKYRLYELAEIEGFVRIHNSYVVAKSYTQAVFLNINRLILHDGRELPIGDKYHEVVGQFINLADK